MEIKLIDIKKSVTTYLRLKGWERNREGWFLSTGPNTKISCGSLGMALDHQLEQESKGSLFS